MPTTRSEVFDRALQEERQRNVRHLNVTRLAGVTLFMLIRVGSNYTGSSVEDRVFPWGLVAYWATSVVIFLCALRSERVARWSALAVPFLDIPAVFWTQWQDLPFAHDHNERALANFTLSLFVLLVMLSAFMLKTRQVILAAVIAAGLQLTLQLKADDTTIGMVGGVAVLAVAAALCSLALARRIEMVHSLAAIEVQRERLGRYFSPQVAAHIQQTGLGLAAGTQCEVTVLFADLRQFTALCERLTPAETMALLNDFQGRMVAAVFAHGGTLDKFLGDGLMAYFGAPVTQADHPAQGVRCALAMQSALKELNESREKQGLRPLRMGVGLHTGPVVIGAIGTQNRREFTAVGDAVNTASRLEDLTRHYTEDILLSEDTARWLGGDIPLRSVGETQVRGRAQIVRLFTPAAPAGNGGDLQGVRP